MNSWTALGPAVALCVACSSESPVTIGSDSNGGSGGSVASGANDANDAGLSPGVAGTNGTASSSDGGTIVVASFVVPSNTVVQQFALDVTAPEPMFATAGRVVEVAVLDVSRPDRDQAALCPTDHPLAGCATVDYGAFGPTYDNQIIGPVAEGSLELHLFKNRSIEPTPEPLLPGE